MTRFATAFALALVAAGAAQAESLVTRADTGFVQLDARDRSNGQGAKATLGIAKTVAASTVYDAQTRGLLNLSADDEVTVTAFESNVSGAAASAR